MRISRECALSAYADHHTYLCGFSVDSGIGLSECEEQSPANKVTEPLLLLRIKLLRHGGLQRAVVSGR